MYGIKTLSAAVIAACMLAACGGGGGGDTPNNEPTGGSQTGGGTGTGGGTDGGTGGGTGGNAQPGDAIKGVWTGTTTSQVGPRALIWDTTTVALENGRSLTMTSEFYTSTTTNAPERNLIGGVVVGQGTAANGSYSFENGRDFPFEDVTPEWRERPASLSASYTSQNTLNGSITSPETPVRNFTSNYAPRYNGAASLGDLDNVFNNPSQRSIQGFFYTANPNGGSIRTEVQLVVGTDGTLSSRAAAPSCQVSGSLTPRTDMRVFDANLTFGAGNCPYPSGTTLTGAAFLKSTVATTRNAQPVENRFHLVAANAGQTQATVFAQVLLADAPQQ
ncbi:hypothetical protein [Caldimonas tepidiphila]|uniref:hypothetical protein n=1 Tax=Caldimonas tepidiphila TaxID=2315841 RepID=UPI001300817D|nr:hypothetical protein [Caldimonas tepidiphila]